MGKKYLRFGHAYEIDPWGGAHEVPGAAQEQISPVKQGEKRLRGTAKYEPAKRPTTESDIRVRDQQDTGMQEATGSTDATAAPTATKAATGSKKSAHETEIIPQQPHYGIPEVATVIFPFTTYFSIVTHAENYGNSVDFRIRCNTLYDCMPDALSDRPAAGAAYSLGKYDVLAGGGTTWQAALKLFPTSAPTGSNTGEAPQWREWYAKLYEHYSCLKTEWEVTFHNPRSAVNSDILIAYSEEAHKAAEASGNTVPDSISSVFAENFPGLTWRMLHSQSDGAEDKNWLTCKGTYYPNMANKNVTNDEDVKTWTAMGATPSLTELIHFKLWKAAFNDQTISQAINVRVHLRITAQLRDLKEVFRYPAAQTAVSLAAPTDIRGKQS